MKIVSLKLKKRSAALMLIRTTCELLRITVRSSFALVVVDLIN